MVNNDNCQTDARLYCRSFIFALVGLFCVLMVPACDTDPGYSSGKELHGVIVNADTGEPIPDAIVVADWITSSGTAGGSELVCFHVGTATTNAAGEYYMPAWRHKSPFSAKYERSIVIFAYKPGYRWPYPKVKYGNYPTDTLVLSRGSVSERLDYLEEVDRQTDCFSAYESMRALLPLRQAIYEEVRTLSASDEQRSLAKSLCERIAEAAIISERGYADPELELKITRYLSDHYPECLLPEHFMEVATAGDYASAARMLTNGLDPYAKDKNEGSLPEQIMRSQKINASEKARYLALLTEKGGNPYKSGLDTVMWSANRGEPDAIKLAVAMIEASSRQPNFSQLPYETRFAGVMKTERPEILDAFIRAGFRVNEPIEDDLTLLMTNTRWPRRSNLIQFFVERGANVNLRDKDGRTALHHALTSRDGGAYAIELIKNGADVNALDKYGRTPLFYAVSINRRDMVKALLENGADPLKQDERGKTALWYATMQEGTDEGIIRQLIHAEKSIPAERAH